MAQEDFFLQREREMALHTYAQNRGELIEFYRRLGQMGNEKIPKDLAAEEKKSKLLLDAEKLLKSEIKVFSKRSFNPVPDDLNLSVARLCVAMFLIERVKKLQEIVLSRNSLSLFSLYVSTRNTACEVLEEKFYFMNSEEMIGSFLDLEPLLIACSELCGLAVPPLDEIVKEYKSKLADEVEKKPK